MNQAIVDAQPISPPADVVLQTTMIHAGIPVDPLYFEGMVPEVANKLNDVILVDPLRLQVYLDDYDRIKTDIASPAPARDINSMIAEFVAYEPYSHIGIIFLGQQELERKQMPLTDQQQEIVNDLTNFRFQAARHAVEASMIYQQTSNPTELWNYFDRMLSRLEKQFMRIGHMDQEIAREIIEEIGDYKNMQDRLVFE